MKMVNKFFKFWGYLLVYLLTFFESYLIALLGVSVVASLICAVWSFITPLPAYISEHYGVLLLQGTIPVAFITMFYILLKVKKDVRK